jgi:hypothetical protein
LWLIKVWFSASTFVVKIATFAKPENVVHNSAGKCSGHPHWHICLPHIPARHQSKQKSQFLPRSTDNTTENELTNKIYDKAQSETHFKKLMDKENILFNYIAKLDSWICLRQYPYFISCF